MELKKDTNDKTESGKKPTGLKLVGVDTDQMREQAQTSMQEVWDFSEGAETMSVRSVESALKRGAKERKPFDAGRLILIVSQIISYLLLVAEIVCLAYITTLEPVFILDHIAKYKGVFFACSAYFFVDAIIVSIISEANFFLFLSAWFLPFLYPGARQLHVKGNFGIGVWITIFYFFSLCGFFAFMGSQVMYYGGILEAKDVGTKRIAAELLEQPMKKGETIGKMFSKNFSVDEVMVSKKGSTTKVTFSGKGVIYYSNDMLIRGVSKSIPTKMVFVREGSDAEYKISGVTAKDVELSGVGVESYWKQMVEY